MSRAHPFVIYCDGDGRQQLIELLATADRLAIGRRPNCDIALTWDDEVSRMHAELVRMGSEWVVHDDGLSHNGTFVNDARVRGRRRLQAGDVIRAGRTVLSVCAEEHPSTAAPTRRSRDRDARSVHLTPAQRRLLEALCRPLRESPYRAPASNRELAAELMVSLETVKSTLTALFALFGLSDLPQNTKRATLAAEALTVLGAERLQR